ncbi:MAG TPA: hypothetical protein VFO76_12485, partial [Candidatus Kapabacteria bacterium]|nr:hypothetical protein [Candidatus Kapabacteria bacterium]
DTLVSAIYSVGCLDKQHIYVSTDKGIFYSTDGGSTDWHLGNGGVEGIALSYLTVFDGRVYAASSQKCYTTNDGGKSWEEMFSLPVTPRSMLLRSDFFLITDGSSYYRSVDSGKQWVVSAAPAAFTNCIDTANGALYACTKGSDIFRSSDKGISWEPIFFDHYVRKTASFGFDSYSDLTTTPTQTLIYSSSEHETYRSHDDGQHWMRGDTIDDPLTLRTIQLLSTPDSFVYKITYNGKGHQYFSSSNDGDTWKELPGITTNTSFSPVHFFKDKNNSIYLLDNGFRKLSADRSSWKLLAKADTIISSQEFIPKVAAIDSLNNARIVSGIDVPFFLYNVNLLSSDISKRNGFTSIQYPNGIECDRRNNLYLYTAKPGTIIRFPALGSSSFFDTISGSIFSDYDIVSVVIDRNQYLIALTNGGGIFRTTEPVVMAGVTESQFNNTPAPVWCSPNPCYESTTLHYPPLKSNKAIFILFDDRGHTVKRIDRVSDEQDGVLILNNIPAGAYVGELIENDRIIATTKLIVLQ